MEEKQTVRQFQVKALENLLNLKKEEKQILEKLEGVRSKMDETTNNYFIDSAKATELGLDTSDFCEDSIFSIRKDGKNYLVMTNNDGEVERPLNLLTISELADVKVSKK